MGLKAPDWAATCFLCHTCHMEIDQGSKLTKAERWDKWLAAYWKSLAWAWEAGLICVAADPEPHVNEPKRPGKKIPKGHPIQNRGFPAGKRPFR